MKRKLTIKCKASSCSIPTFLLLAVLVVLHIRPAACQNQPTASPNSKVDELEPHVAVRPTHSCKAFKPDRCWYERGKDGDSSVIPDCMEGHTCKFDVRKRLKCPFWASGSYRNIESGRSCSSASMEERFLGPNPTCANSCCTADPGPGSWIADRNAPGHLVFKPDNGCEYHQYSRAEILEFYQGTATDILVVGDSFMRQLFVRLTHILRGQERVVDFKIHTHASYATCDEVDNFLVSPAYTPSLTADKDKQFRGVDTFFHLQNISSEETWSTCSDRPMQVNYLFGSTFRQQERNIQRYASSGFQKGSQVDVIISVMFWTHAWETPQEWLDAISVLKSQSFVRKVFLLGIPTARVSPSYPEYVKAYQNRNRMMREWVANQTEGAAYIDFDVLSTAPNTPGACDKKNKHYACHLRYADKPNLNSSSGEKRFYEPVHETPLSGLYGSEDGECYDDMNAAVWQLYFNVAMKGKEPRRNSRQKSALRNSGKREEERLDGLRTLFVYLKHFFVRINRRGVI